jgi:hypothetical protein
MPFTAEMSPATMDEQLNRKEELPELRQIHEALQRLAEVPDELVVSRGHELLAEISAPAVIKSLLDGVRSDPRALRAVAGQSYRHINHFDKIVLIGSPDPAAYRLTLHSWALPYEEDEVLEETIHDHRFDFWSNVLFGTQVSFNYVEDPAGSTYRKYRYTPENRDVNFSEFYEYRGEVKLQPHSVDTRHPGSQYHMLAGKEIHQVLVSFDEPMATLVLRGPRLRSYANIFNTSYPVEGKAFANVMFTPEQLRAKLDVVCAQLTGRVHREARCHRA